MFHIAYCGAKMVNSADSIDTIEQALQDFFREHSEKSYRLTDILAALGIEDNRSSAVKRVLRHMVRRKDVLKLKGKRFSAVQLTHVGSGTFEAGRFGAGYIRAPDTPRKIGEEWRDLYVPPGCSGTALPGDLVKVEILARKTGPSPEARVIRVVKRTKHEFVGEFHKGTGGGFVLPDSEFLKRQIFVPERKSRKAQHGQRVMVKVTEWENEYANPVGEIVEIIGFPGEKGVDVLSMALAAGIPLRFPNKVLREAESLIPLDGKQLVNTRKDFRDEEVFTIDPEDAKDFDDAVSLTPLRKGAVSGLSGMDGNYLLGVYIADVTAYVQEGSAIDKEAAQRGTSVYLIDKVIPMLPERLSEDLCSLQPHEDRPVFCIRIICTPQGDVVDYEIAEGVICSKHRFTYKEAQKIIDGKKKGPFQSTLREMNRFAKKLREKRFKTGGMDFYVPEITFQLDKYGIPTAVRLKPVLETNNMIEEFMLLANCVAARHKAALERRYTMSLPYLYRVHENPDEASARGFWELARSLGCTVNEGTPGSSQWFQNILNYFDDKPEKIFIEEIALRSMMKAMYQPQNIGHFGLGFKEYTHFTSPIRRYPDLVVHRLLKKYTAGINSGEIVSVRRRLSHVGRHSTDTEIRAMKAERDVIKLKQLEYMQNKLGEVYGGVISGVTSFGIFIELEEILVEGLVHVRDLGDDFYVYEEEKYRLVGERSGKIFKLGDRVAVQVIKVNVERGHLDFIVI